MYAPAYKISKIHTKIQSIFIQLSNTFITSKSMQHIGQSHLIQNIFVWIYHLPRFYTLPRHYSISTKLKTRLHNKKYYYYIRYLRKTTYNLKLISVSPETVCRRGISYFMSGSWNIFTYSENLVVKNMIETRDIIFYNRYFDDILQIFDCSKITTDEILHFINNIQELLEFTLTCGEIEKIIFLHLLISRN